MQKDRLLWMVVLAVALLISLPRHAYAYIDPGTTGSIFAMLAPFLAIFLAFLGFMVRPFRRLFASLATKLRGNTSAESPASDEQPVSVESPDDEKS